MSEDGVRPERYASRKATIPPGQCKTFHLDCGAFTLDTWYMPIIATTQITLPVEAKNTRLISMNLSVNSSNQKFQHLQRPDYRTLQMPRYH